MPKYKITIEKADWVKRVAGRDWAIIGGAAENPERGYTPEIEKTVWEHNEIYTQTVEDLDLAKVVAVVNGLDSPKAS